MGAKKGKIQVIHGPMFSGKTEELLRRVRRARIAKKNIQLFKPKIDNRYDSTRILPHYMANSKDSHAEEAAPVNYADEIEEFIQPNVQLVGIEEAQFFDFNLFHLVRKLSHRSIDVVMSLLDQDYRRMPFPIQGSSHSVGEYLAIAHESVKLYAVCVICGNEAQHTQKLSLSGMDPNGNPIYLPASFYSEVVAVGTSKEILQEKLFPVHSEHIYEARCANCHEVRDEPADMF